MYTTHTETLHTNMWDAGMTSETCVKDAYIAYVQAMPYTVVNVDGYTFSVGGADAFVPCYTKKGLLHGIKKLLGMNDGRVQKQFDAYTVCHIHGTSDTALCHRLPRSLGGTPTHNNVDYECATCNGKHSNQIVKSVVRAWLKSQKIVLTYTVTTLV
jgi:hypothetical protein